MIRLQSSFKQQHQTDGSQQRRTNSPLNLEQHRSSPLNLTGYQTTTSASTNRVPQDQAAVQQQQQQQFFATNAGFDATAQASGFTYTYGGGGETATGMFSITASATRTDVSFGKVVCQQLRQSQD